MAKSVFHAFIDESGDPHFSNGSSDTFLICATLINENNILEITDNLKSLLAEYKLPELKSSRMGDDRKRFEILNRISKWNVSIVTIFVKKEDFDKTGQWFKYHGTFYKYIERLLVSEVVRIYGNVDLTFDTFGKADYRESFVKYIEKIVAKSSQIDLFTPDIVMSSPKSEILVQLSDILAGSIRKYYENKLDNVNNILEPIWKGSLIVGEPNWMKMLKSDISNEDSQTDEELKRVALNSVNLFIEDNKRKEDRAVACETLDYLKGTLLYDDPNKYCYRTEIKDWLNYRGYKDYSEEKVSREVISLLREEGVMLVSSSEGIKIPSSVKDVKDHYEFILGQAIPSLKRLKKMHQVISARLSSDAISFIDGETNRLLNDLSDYR
ncbi:MAG: DUF3800 domain-containing protein [Fibrobacter sp.]|nr:DUF3800 domain-containing protein [Fibrobacter sp.]